MKHHEYQIYYGGFKIKLLKYYYCKECGIINWKKPNQHQKNHVRSHKKQTVIPRLKLNGGKRVISEKN